MALTAKKVYAILKRQISDMEAKIKTPIIYRGTVATADLLPKNPKIGDMYNIESKSIYGEAGMNVAWNGVVWDTMGAPIDMSLYIKSNELADWVKQQNKPTYTANEVGALPADTKIPSKTSELKNDSGFLTKVPDSYLNGTDTTLKESGKAADAKATGDKFTEISADISKKLDKNQGSENSGKIAGINEAGDIVPMFPIGVEYNSETNCLEFGSDQKMELNQGIGLDSTLTKAGSAADAGAVGEITNSLKEDLDEIISSSKNLFNADYLLNATGWTKSEDGAYVGQVGQLNALFGSSDYLFDDGIVLRENKQYTVSFDVKTDGSQSTTGSGLQFYIYHTDGSEVHDTIENDQVEFKSITLTSISNKTVRGIRITYGSSPLNYWYLRNIQFEEGAEKSEYTSHISAFDKVAREKIEKIDAEKIAFKTIGKNVLDKSKSVDGHILNDGSIELNANYKTSDFIPIKSGESITVSPYARKAIRYDANYNVISDSYINDNTNNLTVTASVDGYFRFSYDISYNDVIMAEYGSVATDYEPYRYIIEENTHISETMKSDINDFIGYRDVLFGKKWVACGDSFTQGDFTGISDYTFLDSPYIGCNKVYPYYIGRRCGMNIVNEAISGSTIAYVDGQRNEFSTQNGRYTLIPSDADYITLYFGINDGHQSVPIGTINDKVNTTFYGAWNIAMREIITTHPYAKIGIIVSNGMDRDEYVEATINIAKKWGVPYLNLDGDYQVPLMHRTRTRTETCDEVKEIRMNAFVCSDTNSHPNPKAHEYESTFIENWLRSL